MTHHIVYIHGAFSSANSFSQIMANLPSHVAYAPEYTVEQDLESIIQDISDMITSLDIPVSIISHSLGGVIAVAVSQINPLVERILTMSTPFGGSKAADLLKWFNHHIMFESICTTSPTLIRINKTPITCPVKSIVTSKCGSMLFMEPNDGVVTVGSQMSLLGPDYTPMKVGHSEVLRSDDTVKIAQDFIFK